MVGALRDLAKASENGVWTELRAVSTSRRPFSYLSQSSSNVRNQDSQDEDFYWSVCETDLSRWIFGVAIFAARGEN
jgi:hypothetical protein